MALTGYPVEDLALRASFVEASVAALHGLAGQLMRPAWAGSPSWSATWTAGPTWPRGSGCPPAPRRTPPHCCTAARW